MNTKGAVPQCCGWYSVFDRGFWLYLTKWALLRTFQKVSVLGLYGLVFWEYAGIILITLASVRKGLYGLVFWEKVGTSFIIISYSEKERRSSNGFEPLPWNYEY